MKGLIRVKSIKSFLSPRVLRVALVMFIFVSMLINGFVPKSVESRESFAAIVGAVVNNVIVETFKNCADTLTVMSNKIAKDLYKYLRLGEVGTTVPINGGNEKQEDPANTSSDNCLVVVQREYKNIVNYSETIQTLLISEGKINEKLYRLYNNVKVYCDIERIMGVLFFIVFVVAIRNRKEDITNIKNRDIAENRTNLC